MSALKLASLLFFIFLFSGCSSDDAEVVIDNLSYEIIFESQLSYSRGEKIPKQYKVFTDREDWLDFIPTIEEVNPDRAENLENIDFDFTNANLIIVIGEFYNSCCTKITINQVYKRSDNIIVDFEESEPGVAAALSQTYLLLKTQKQN